MTEKKLTALDFLNNKNTVDYESGEQFRMQMNLHAKGISLAEGELGSKKFKRVDRKNFQSNSR